MYSVIVFFCTAVQLLIVGLTYFLKAESWFALAVMYGSPPYLIRNMFSAESAWLDAHPIYLGLFIYHVTKYGLFFRARMSEDSKLLMTAVVFEATYLAICAYYLF